MLSRNPALSICRHKNQTDTSHNRATNFLCCGCCETKVVSQMLKENSWTLWNKHSWRRNSCLSYDWYSVVTEFHPILHSNGFACVIVGTTVWTNILPYEVFENLLGMLYTCFEHPGTTGTLHIRVPKLVPLPILEETISSEVTHFQLFWFIRRNVCGPVVEEEPSLFLLSRPLGVCSCNISCRYPHSHCFLTTKHCDCVRKLTQRYLLKV